MIRSALARLIRWALNADAPPSFNTGVPGGFSDCTLTRVRRLDPMPCDVVMDFPMTDEGAAVISDMVSQRLGGRVGLRYTKPDGSAGSVARY